MRFLRWTLIYRSICVVGVAAFSVYGLCRFIAPMSGITEILSYGAPIWPIGLAGMSALFVLERELRRFVWAPLISLVVTLAGMGIFESRPATPSHVENRFDLITFNISFSNRRIDDVIAFLREEPQASIVALLEVSKDHEPALEALVDVYPYKLKAGITNTAYGLMLFSKWPMDRIETGDGELPSRSILARVDNKDESFLVLATHLFSLRSKFPERHRTESNRLITFLSKPDEPMIVLGDFNSTPWSGRLSAIRASGNLVPARGRLQWAPTWPAHRWWTYFPVDHILLSPDTFDLHAFERGPRQGSDHHALRATISMVDYER